MPNWVTNKITAPKHVIEAMLNAEGRIDFNTVVPFQGPHDWDGIYGDAETAAEVVCRVPLSDHQLVSRLEAFNRANINIKEMREESFEQFLGMLRNFRACGHLHSMDFARKVWGTKWNACDPTADTEAGTAQFETAWSCPEGVLLELSKRFPDDTISITFADEDIGSNCGTFALKGGKVIEQDIAPNWRDMSDEDRQKWKAFAYQVKGWTPEPDEEEDEADHA